MTDSLIHETAIISPTAQIGPNVKIGPYAVIGPEVTIGEGTIIHPHVVITGHTLIGKECEFFQGASIGEVPQDLKYRGENTTTIIGDHVTIRECASVHRAVGEGNETRIGNNVLMMAYTHVAHNCIVGNNVIMSNVATLAGHVIVEDRAVIGGLTAVHQFTKIGRNCMCGGMSRISQDVPPFVIVAGNPPYVYKRGLSLPEAISTMEQELNSCEEVEHFMRFLRTVERGICRASSHGLRE